ncbi:MAG: hypothetical protein IPN57_09710 [Ignavibacteria bacterium]|nr:hypothetical protein [Ignavibacteria bacterium]
MRKIKLVKLNKEFNNGKYNKAIGTPLEYQQFYDLYKLHFCGQDACYFTEEDINKNTAGLFTIEYEPEGFELKRYTEYGFLDYDSFMERELNRLADWCDGQSEGNDCHYMITCSARTESFDRNRYSMNMIHHGLKFNSNDSASLFITELNKPENSDYKKYFIELLKKTRL